MLKYYDGTPASTPQMAHDVATFLDYLENHNLPDMKLTLYMYFLLFFFLIIFYFRIWTGIAIWLPISWIYAKYHEFNHHSYRYEVYALRDASGYNKFKDKIFKHHKNKYVYRGEFS